MNNALTWENLANIYDKEHTGRPARTLPMETIFNWAAQQGDRFCVSDEGTLHEIDVEKEKQNER